MKLLEAFRTRFEEPFIAHVESYAQRHRELHPEAGSLADMILGFVRTGGKRFRPALFYYAAGAIGEKDPAFVHFSFLFELFHTFALIHDDIIDQAPLRRNQPTVYRRYGTGPAILSGDLALMMADEIAGRMLDCPSLTPSNRERMSLLYNRYKQELIVGQYLDYVHIPEVSLIMDMKTSQYSFVRPAKFGFHFAGLPQKQVDAWEGILAPLGILFQMKDDFEGVFGSEEELGKSTTSDVAEGKNTLVIEQFRKSAKPKELKRFISFFGSGHVGAQDFAWLRERLDYYEVGKTIRENIQKEALRIEKRIKKTGGETAVFAEFVMELLGLINSFSP